MALQAFEPGRRSRRRGKKTASEATPGDGLASPDVITIPSDASPSPDSTVTVKPDTGSVEIEHADGSIVIDPTGASLWQQPDEPDSHDENLALKIDPIELGRIADALLDGIEADKRDRTQWEQMRAKCIELLGIKLEDPKGDVSRSSMGMATSVVRDPTLLESVERFRANAYAELCPAAGPVKVVNFSDDAKSETDQLATDLQRDLNYYLTTTASEYYPDTRYMLWWTGLASGTFKKVYRCPLRQRPVSEYVDGTDLIVPSTATDLKNADRVTHQVKMARHIMRAMQLEGVYRDVNLSEPMQTALGPVAAKIANVGGTAAQPQRVEDQEYTVYECYCRLDVRGYEHKIKGNPTGLPIPYRVTIEETSRQVLEIRRNWDAEDDDELHRPANIPFVPFNYSTGVSRIYGSGLGQMLGNMASALTALLRISIDNGMLSNYPGLLKAKGTGRQLQNEIMVPPGGVAEIDTGGQPIQTVVMGMPFKDISQAVIALIEQTRGVAQRLGGTADLPVGEGKQDAPVGTTLALIEQATKIEGSVHKALHAAQSEEFRLLVKLFRDDPEALWRGNRRPAMGRASDDAAKSARLARFKKALDNCDIVPFADPNVPSDMHRNMMAMGFKQFAAGNPSYDQVKVDRYVSKQMFKIDDATFDSFLAPPTPMQQPPTDPLAMAALELKAQEVQIKREQVQMQAQNAHADRQSKENIEAARLAVKTSDAGAQGQPGPSPIDAQVQEAQRQQQAAELALKHRQQSLNEARLAVDAHNKAADREAKMTTEALKVASTVGIHPDSDAIVDQQIQQMAPFMTPARRGDVGGGMARGGVVDVSADRDIGQVLADVARDPRRAMALKAALDDLMLPEREPTRDGPMSWSVGMLPSVRPPTVRVPTPTEDIDREIEHALALANTLRRPASSLLPTHR